MPLFRRGGPAPRTSPDAVIHDRCWDDPALDEVLDRLAGRPAPEAVGTALAHLATLRSDPERQVQAAEALGEKLTGALGELGQQAETARGDAGTADALALLGTALAYRAWEVRGSGRAAGVSEDRFEHFHALLRDADEVSVSALARVPGHPAAATARLRTALGLGAPQDEWWQRFEVARERCGTLFPAHWLMLTGMCRKWHGSEDLMFDFARRVATSAPPGDPVVAVLPLAYVEFMLSVIMFPEGRNATMTWAKTYDRGRDEVIAAADRWAGGGTVPPHPRNLEAHQLFGWFFAGVRNDRARRHLEEAGLRINGLPWAYLGEPVEAFLRSRAQAGLP